MPDLRTERDVVYGGYPGRNLLCDVYYPPEALNKRTAVIHLHGGAFRVGDKSWMETNARLYAERGYLSVAAQYRLQDEAKWPAPLHDVKACIRWLRANAGSLGIDAAKVAVAGHSAGSIIALVASGTAGRADLEGDGGSAGVDSAPAACIAYYPPDTMRRAPDGADSPAMPPGAGDDAYRDASPISHAGPGFPPALLLHGTSDRLVPHAASQRLFEALLAAGVPVELHLFPGIDHEFDQTEEWAVAAAQTADFFLDRHVADPRTYPPFQPGVPRAPVRAG